MKLKIHSLLLASALALVLILEGLLPFLNPAAWRRVFERALKMSDAQIAFGINT